MEEILTRLAEAESGVAQMILPPWIVSSDNPHFLRAVTHYERMKELNLGRNFHTPGMMAKRLKQLQVLRAACEKQNVYDFFHFFASVLQQVNVHFSLRPTWNMKTLGSTSSTRA